MVIEMCTARLVSGRRNIVSSVINALLNIILPFLIRTVMIHWLGELYLGLNGVFVSVLQVLSLAELGFGSAMTFSMYKPIAENKIEDVCALLALYKKIYRYVGSIILAGGILITPFLSKMIKGDIPSDINIYIVYYVMLGNTVISYFLYAYKSSLLEASQRLDILTNISSIIKFFFNILQMGSIIVFHNYYLYCILIPLSTIINGILVNRITNIKFPNYICRGNIKPVVLHEIKKRVWGLFIYKICAVCRNSFDSIVISSMLGLLFLTKYQNYYYILASVGNFLIIITNSITAGVGNSIIQETREKNHEDFLKIQLVYMWLSGWFTVCMFGLYQPFMKMWMGEKLLLGSFEMVMFCIYFFCLRLGDVCFMYRQAAGLWWEDRYRPFVEALINLILDFILVKYIGITGVLLATVLTLLGINTVWGSRVLYKHYFHGFKNTQYLLRLLLFSIVTLGEALLSIFLIELFDISGFKELVYNAVVCTIVPNIINWVIYHNLKEYPNAQKMILAFFHYSINNS